MATNEFQIEWLPRDSPLMPQAAAAYGEASLRLARYLLQLDDEALSQFNGVADTGLIVVQGDEEHLPWIDGVQYLGSDPAAPSLLLPTNYRPNLPEALVERALLARAQTTARLAVLARPFLLVPMYHASPVSRRTLDAWMKQQ